MGIQKWSATISLFRVKSACSSIRVSITIWRTCFYILKYLGINLSVVSLSNDTHSLYFPWRGNCVVSKSVFLLHCDPTRAVASTFRTFIYHYNDTPQSVGLLCAGDQLVTETSTWQHTTNSTDRHPCSRWDSNPQSQQASDRRPTS